MVNWNVNVLIIIIREGLIPGMKLRYGIIIKGIH